MTTTVLFILAAAAVLVSAFRVVTSPDLVRSVFWLAAMSMTVAAFFVLLHSGFVGAVQVLLYTGGVVTLMLFGVMLTVTVTGSSKASIPHESHNHVKGVLVSGVLFLLMAGAILSSPLPDRPPPDTTARDIGRAFLTDWLLSLEALSVLLLAAMIGAIVLARREDPS